MAIATERRQFAVFDPADGSLIDSLQSARPEDGIAAVDAAEAVGDDRIQKKMQGQVSPESFTHGTSAQRHAWLQQGFSTGDPNKCNTFSAGTL